MDTSKEYIDMCRKAKEIQSKPIIEKNCFGISLHEETIGEEVFGEIDNNKGYYRFWGVYCDNVQFVGTIPDECIFLPRQDQLQKMIDIDVITMCTWFDEFVTNHYSELFNNDTSMEQLWLAFVMSERYQKYWNGKTWEVQGG